MEKLFAWAKEGGAKMNGFKVRWFSETNRGIIATKDFKMEELFYSVPRKMQIT